MKRYINRKKITAVFFLILLFSFSIVNAVHTAPFLKTIEGASTTKEKVASLDVVINENVIEKYQFIEANGLVYDFLNKKEMNNFSLFKDDNGMLYLEDYASYVTQYHEEARDMSYVSQMILDVQAYFKDKGTPMLFTLYPDKVPKGNTHLKKGYPYNYANETMDSLQSYLKDKIPCLDFREVEGIKGKNNVDVFYKTDHHWKTESAFIGFQNLVSTFRDTFHVELDPTGYYTNLNNYNAITYPSMFIGSLARKTGTSFAGIDDFTLLYPKFSTNFQYYFDAGAYEDTREGKFEYALINPMYFNEKQKYGSYTDTYATYLYGNHGYASITNKSSDNDIKVLFIKDSFALPMVSFFANTLKQVDLLDPRFFEGDIQSFLDEKTYDYVVFGYSESVLQVEHIPILQ